MKPIALVVGVISVLLGGLWLLQGLGVVHVRPILCFADCAPIQGPLSTWAIVGILVLIAGVPDLAAVRRYYDDLMPILGLREWFKTGLEGSFNYGPDGARGSQLFFYQAREPGTYSHHGTGLQHIAFLVESRAIVREAHDWARAHNGEIVREPRHVPKYGEHCYATYWLDPHGFMLEVVCHSPEEMNVA